MVERIYDTQAAAGLLKRLIGDRRNYVQLLQDTRRGRRNASIHPAFYAAGKAFYLGSDLLAYADSQVARGGKSPSPEFITVEGGSLLEILTKAKRLCQGAST